MSELPQALRDHLAGAVTSVCFCWIVRRRDGAVLGFTDHDRPLVAAGVACEPATGFAAGAVESGLGLAVDTAEVAGALSSEAISEADIEAGKYDGATVEQWLVNWAEPGQAGMLKRHVIGEIRRLDGAFRVELRSLSAAFDERRGRHFLRRCDADLGDARCGFDTSAPGFSAAGVVVAVEDGQVRATGLAGFGEGWFVHGRLAWTSGARSGTFATVAAVRDRPGGESAVSLFGHDLAGIASGDTFTVHAGCDKRFATCREKFSNGLNFRGFPHIPGNDAALTYADGEGDFNGGPLVP
ncbi:DUF2163 domain-containing protein [Oricola thermophila]|uniref:DUF2163 domain-containing protein n=1 Tax=Oricola thermophila TaxID=2742145 RepID=A0A6N1VG64_9HYPH|nr:DUF2163 domain-containing protein [Oricola thermophila]QKV18625.1 DUF2163 domain-containing protein [Oricola thermophila]